MSRFFYNIKQAFVQMWRNKGMTVASLFAITAMLLILGVFFVITMNVNMFTEAVKQDYDTVEIFLEDSTDEARAEEIMNEFKGIEGVSEVRYRTKEQAMNILRERWGESGYLLDSLGDNPLPNSVLVEVNDLDAANTVNENAKTMEGVESTKYYKDTVDRLTKVTRFIQIGAIAIMIFLVFISVIVVSNTIKLTVFARAKEISIMKYIGATNWFIRLPFLFEGILIGIISSAIASAICFVIYAKLVSAIGQKVLTILSFSLVPANYLALNLVIIFVAMGVGIGACGSIVSMRRFLDV